MDRPQIEFVQAQALPWSKASIAGPAGVKVKVLSEDPALGESTALVRYPAGWRRADAEYLTVDEEIFVIDGALRIGAVTYSKYDYAYLPKGFPREGAAAPEGAVVLTFYYGAPEARTGAPPPGLYDAARLVPRANLYEDGWDRDYSGVDSPELANAGARKKTLRTDPVAGDQTWLIGTLPLWRERKTETHPVVQEMYLLEGEIAGNTGVMKPGAYFWRPPDILHGPYGSKTGNVILMRSRGGSLSTNYYDPPEPFTFDAPHRPVLPPHLAALGAAPWQGSEPY